MARLRGEIPDTKEIWLKALYLLVSCVLIIGFIEHLRELKLVAQQLSWGTFYYSEFLINFEGGFVRRGLLGEMIFTLSATFGTPPHKIIWIISYGAFAFVTIFFFAEFLLKRKCWWIVLTPFLCGLTENIIRKDYLCYVLMILSFALVRGKDVTQFKFFFIAAIGVLGLFLHEAFIFFGIPLMIAVMYGEGLRRQAIVYALICMAVFIMFCVVKGNQEVADGIIDSWNALRPEMNLKFNQANSIGALTWDLGSTCRNHFMLNFYSPAIGWGRVVIRIAVLFLSIVFVSNYFVTFTGNQSRKSRYDAEKDSKAITGCYIFSLICLTPMFLVLSCDLERLYQYAFMASFIPFLLLPRKKIFRTLPLQYWKTIIKLNRKLTLTTGYRRVFVVLAVMLFCSNPVGSYLGEELGATPMGGFLEFLCHYIPRLIQ